MSIHFHKKYFLIPTTIIALFTMLLTSGIQIQIQTTNIKAFAQTGSNPIFQGAQASYAVSIVPGAAQRDSPYHYFPPVINVPKETTVAWFNNDFGQPHTVTSGAPNGSDVGVIFNSGIMPATSNALFQHTFNVPGDYLYHCQIHPWRVALVSVADAYETGQYFKMASGVGSILNLTTDFRTLLNFEPLTVPLDNTTPLAYNITILKNSNETIFSETFVTSGQSLPLELVRSEGNETISYGPDFSSTGAYHLEAPFLNDETDFIIVAELMTIDSKKPEIPIVDEFYFKTVS